MKFILLFVLVYWSSGLLSQTPPSTDNSQKDSLTIEDAADTDPEFIGGFDGLIKYLNDSLRWEKLNRSLSFPLSNQ